MKKQKVQLKQGWIDIAKAKVEGVTVDGVALIAALQNACPGLTKTEMAEILGVKVGTIGDYASNHKRSLPSLVIAAKVALIADVDLRHFAVKENTIKS